MSMPIRPSAVAAHVARRQAVEQATAEERLRAIAALHRPSTGRRTRCLDCGGLWPCRTTLIVGGDHDPR